VVFHFAHRHSPERFRLRLADGFCELLPIRRRVVPSHNGCSPPVSSLWRQAIAKEALVAIAIALVAVGAYRLLDLLGATLVGAH